jgi:hypothetical protein
MNGAFIGDRYIFSAINYVNLSTYLQVTDTTQGRKGLPLMSKEQEFLNLELHNRD